MIEIVSEGWSFELSLQGIAKNSGFAVDRVMFDMGRLDVMDRWTKDTQFETIVGSPGWKCPKGKVGWSVEVTNALATNITIVRMNASQPLDIVLSPPCLFKILSVFDTSHLELILCTRFVKQISNEFHRYSEQQLHWMQANKKPLEIQIELPAPNLVIPSSLINKQGPVLVASMGQARVTSREACLNST